jgi:hypothetical protein
MTSFLGYRKFMDAMVDGLLAVLLMVISLHPSRFENWMTGES